MSSNKFIPLSVPNLAGNELKYVHDAVSTGWVSSVGSYVNQFEEKFAEYVGTKHAVAVVNGTAALHISLMLVGVKEGEEVLMPDLTFVAPANAIRYCFAEPVFIGSEWQTLGMDPELLKSFLEEHCERKEGKVYNKSTGRRIAAIVPMHTFGHPVRMDELMEVANDFGLPVIEDATESLGSEYKGNKTGTFGIMGCFSFNGNKIMTTGGGGMIVTNDDDLAAKAKHLSTTAKTDPIEYDHDEVGYNYRLVNVLAAIGVGQLELMPQFIDTKRNNVNTYQVLLNEIDGMNMFQEMEECQSNYWMYPLILENHKPSDVTKHLGEHKIQARPVWKLMHTLPMYKNCQTHGVEVSEDIYNKVLCVPCSTDLERDDVVRVCETLNLLNS